MDRELQMLLDERAITAVMNDYCHSMDAGQHNRWLSCFTEDALYEVLLPNGTAYARLEGREDFVRFIAGYPIIPGNRHVYVTPAFNVDPDARVADVSCYWFVLAGAMGSTEIGSMGTARDRFVFSDGRWRMKERRITVEGMAQT